MSMVERVLVDDSRMDLHLHGLESGADGSAVVLMFPRSGMDGFPQRVAGELADNGFMVAIPDITHRCPSDMPVRDRKQHLKDAEIVRDIGATLALLTTRFCRSPSALFIMGHCMGGRHAFLGASSFERFDGAAAYYSGDMFEAWGEGPTPFERLRAIRCPVLGFFGAHDKNPSPPDVDALTAELTRAGVGHVFHRYADVGHAFQQNAARSPEERAAADDSFAKTVSFFREVAHAKT